MENFGLIFPYFINVVVALYGGLLVQMMIECLPIYAYV